MGSLHSGEPDSSFNPNDKVAALRQELLELTTANSLVAAKYESKTWFQGLGGFLIVSISTVFGVILGFGFLSIFTGIGGFIFGVSIAGTVSRSSPKQAEYEAKKVRIQEIERILSQLD